jgi:hypothetical protein
MGGALIREEHLDVQVSLTLVKFCSTLLPLHLSLSFPAGIGFSLEAVVRCFHITIHYHSELFYCLLNPV